MLTVDELIDQARHLPRGARRDLRDRLDESLEGEDATPQALHAGDGPYASLLKSAGTAHAVAPDIARHKHEHLADISAAKRRNP